MLVDNLRIEKIINGNLSLDKKNSLRQAAVAGDTDTIMRILRDAGYDGDASDPSIGQSVKKMLR